MERGLLVSPPFSSSYNFLFKLSYATLLYKVDLESLLVGTVSFKPSDVDDVFQDILVHFFLNQKIRIRVGTY